MLALVDDGGTVDLFATWGYVRLRLLHLGYTFTFN